MFRIGDKVVTKIDILEAACGDHPCFQYAKAGDVLVVRDIGNQMFTNYIHVSHEDVLDRTFGVNPVEIELIG